MRGPAAKAGSTPATGAGEHKIRANGSAGTASAAGDLKSAAPAPAAGSIPAAPAANSAAAAAPAVDSKAAAEAIAKLRAVILVHNSDHNKRPDPVAASDTAVNQFIDAVLKLPEQGATVEQICNLLRTKAITIEQYGYCSRDKETHASLFEGLANIKVTNNFCFRILSFLLELLQKNPGQSSHIFSMLEQPCQKEFFEQRHTGRREVCKGTIAGYMSWYSDDATLNKLSELLQALRQRIEPQRFIPLFLSQNSELEYQLWHLQRLVNHNLLPLDEINKLLGNIKFSGLNSNHEYFKLLNDLLDKGVSPKVMFEFLKKTAHGSKEALWLALSSKWSREDHLPAVYFLLRKIRNKSDSTTAAEIDQLIVNTRIWVDCVDGIPPLIGIRFRLFMLVAHNYERTASAVDALYDFLTNYHQDKIVPFEKVIKTKEEEFINSSVKEFILKRLIAASKKLETAAAIKLLEQAKNKAHPLGQLFWVQRSSWSAPDENSGSLKEIKKELENRKKELAAKSAADAKQAPSKTGAGAGATNANASAAAPAVTNTTAETTAAAADQKGGPVAGKPVATAPIGDATTRPEAPAASSTTGSAAASPAVDSKAVAIAQSIDEMISLMWEAVPEPEARAAAADRGNPQEYTHPNRHFAILVSEIKIWHARNGTIEEMLQLITGPNPTTSSLIDSISQKKPIFFQLQLQFLTVILQISRVKVAMQILEKVFWRQYDFAIEVKLGEFGKEAIGTTAGEILFLGDEATREQLFMFLDQYRHIFKEDYAKFVGPIFERVFIRSKLLEKNLKWLGQLLAHGIISVAQASCIFDRVRSPGYLINNLDDDIAYISNIFRDIKFSEGKRNLKTELELLCALLENKVLKEDEAHQITRMILASEHAILPEHHKEYFGLLPRLAKQMVTQVVVHEFLRKEGSTLYEINKLIRIERERLAAANSAADHKVDAKAAAAPGPAPTASPAAAAAAPTPAANPKAGAAAAALASAANPSASPLATPKLSTNSAGLAQTSFRELTRAEQAKREREAADSSNSEGNRFISNDEL